MQTQTGKQISDSSSSWKWHWLACTILRKIVLTALLMQLYWKIRWERMHTFYFNKWYSRATKTALIAKNNFICTERQHYILSQFASGRLTKIVLLSTSMKTWAARHHLLSPCIYNKLLERLPNRIGVSTFVSHLPHVHMHKHTRAKC